MIVYDIVCTISDSIIVYDIVYDVIYDIIYDIM